MKRVIHNYREFLNHLPSILAALAAFVFFIVSLIINFYANQYAWINKGNSVTDILLDNLPVVNMENSFVVGTWLVVLLIIVLLVTHPKKIPFTLKTMALFIIIRSIFVIMTHISPSPLNTLTPPSEIGRIFSSGADLFFSGHTGMPFLYALIYWHNRNLRYIFMGISVLAAVGVILGHIHYSIDVASAYFITYGIYVISERTFKKDRELFFK
jgi:hypothetical protein